MSHRTSALLLFATLTLRAQTTGVIEGHVTNSATGEAVGGVAVRFLDRQSYVYDTSTDPTGFYRLTGLKDSDYRGIFTKDGYVEDTSKLLHVAGDAPVKVDMQFKPWGSLHGRVIGEDGEPAAGVRVEKEPVRIGLLDGDTVTDTNGEFAFPNLPPGSYTVVAKPEAKTRTQDGIRFGAVAIYYPSATEPAQAAPIQVRVGDNVSGLDIRLKSVPVHRIAGVVLNQAGKPAARVTVKLMGRAGPTRQALGAAMILPIRPGTIGANFYTIVGPRAEPEIARVTTNDDGAFEFAAGESGDWRLTAAGGTYDDPLSGVASALVSEKDVDDIQIRLSAPFPLQVTADWGGAQPPAAPTRISPLGNDNGRVTASEPTPPRVNLTQVEGQPSVTGEDYVKNMQRMNSVLPGRYRVMPGGVQSGFYVAAILWGGRDVRGQVVELAPGAGPFQIVYRSGLGTVHGTVDKGEAATVFLISQEPGELLSYRRATCGPSGAYEIADVPPGDYYLVAFDHAESDGLPPADLPFSIVPLASTVRVETSATASVDLRLNRWPW
jgi:hypothetical protein